MKTFWITFQLVIKLNMLYLVLLSKEVAVDCMFGNNSMNVLLSCLQEIEFKVAAK